MYGPWIYCLGVAVAVGTIVMGVGAIRNSRRSRVMPAAPFPALGTPGQVRQRLIDLARYRGWRVANGPVDNQILGITCPRDFHSFGKTLKIRIDEAGYDTSTVTVTMTLLMAYNEPDFHRTMAQIHAALDSPVPTTPQPWYFDYSIVILPLIFLASLVGLGLLEWLVPHHGGTTR